MTNTTSDTRTVFPIVVAGLGLKLNLMPRVTAAKPAANSNEAAPIADPSARFVSQPRCGQQPSERKGSSSTIAAQPQPASVAEPNKTRAPIRNTEVSPENPLRVPPIAEAMTDATTSNSLSTTRNAATKITVRQPLRRCPCLSVIKLWPSMNRRILTLQNAEDLAPGEVR